MPDSDLCLEKVLDAFEVNELVREKYRTHTWYDFKRTIVCSKCYVRLASLIVSDDNIKLYELTCEEIIIKKLLE